MSSSGSPQGELRGAQHEAPPVSAGAPASSAFAVLAALPGARALSPLGTAGSRAFSAALALAALAFSAWLGMQLQLLPSVLAAGSGQGWSALLALPLVVCLLIALGALALALPLALGMPVRVLAAFTAVGTAVTAAVELAGAPLWLTLGLLPLAAVAMFAALAIWALPGGRTLGSAATLGYIGALAAAAGPAALSLGLRTLVDASRAELARSVMDLAEVVALFVGPLLAAWAFAEIGALTRLDGARLLGSLRDALFRVLMPLGGLALAVWLAGVVEQIWIAVYRSTPLEGLAASVGAVLALPVVLASVWAAWRTPQALSAARWAGRIDGRVVAEALLLPACALAIGAVLGAVIGDDGGARAHLYYGNAWLPAAAVYAVARWRSARPLAAPGLPLWLVLPGKPGVAVQQMAGRAAQAWTAGPVTLLALPELLPEIGGDHAHCAEAAGALATLLPTHPAQVDDWMAARPTPWTALPLRELYAPSELWPHILGERIEATALVMRLASRDAQPLLGQPGQPGVLDELATRGALSPQGPLGVDGARFGAALAGGVSGLVRAAQAALPPGMVKAFRRRQPLAWPVARSDAPRIDPLAAGGDETQTAAASGDPIDSDALADWLRGQQQAVAAAAVRHVVIAAAAAEMALAERIAARLDGCLDARGFVVEAIALPPNDDASVLATLLRLPLRTWRLGGRLFGRLLAAGARGMGLRDVALRLLVRAFDVGRGDFELLRIEPGDDTPAAPLDRLFARGLSDGALQRAVLVRPAGRAAAALPEGYTARLLLPPGRDLEAQAAAIAEQTLALAFVVEVPKIRGLPPVPPDPAPPAEMTPDASVAPASASAYGDLLLVVGPGVPMDARAGLECAMVAAHVGADSAAPELAQFDAWQHGFDNVFRELGFSWSSRDEGLVDETHGDVAEDLVNIVLPRARNLSQLPPALLGQALRHARQGLAGSASDASFGRKDPRTGRFVLALVGQAHDGSLHLSVISLVQLRIYEAGQAAAGDAPQESVAAANSALQLRRFVFTAGGSVDVTRLAAARDLLRAQATERELARVVALPL